MAITKEIDNLVTDVFDKLKELKDEDFELARDEILKQYISQFPKHKHMKAKQLQWTIDGLMRKYHDPIKRASVLQSMLYDNLLKLSELIQQIPMEDD